MADDDTVIILGPGPLEERRQRMCTSKRTYTKKEAQEQVNYRSGRKGHRRGANRNIRMYACSFGDHWHLTDREPATIKRGRRT